MAATGTWGRERRAAKDGRDEGHGGRGRWRATKDGRDEGHGKKRVCQKSGLTLTHPLDVVC